VNVGTPRDVSWRGRRVRTSIWKAPVDGPVAVRGVNVAGDDQADRGVHGGPDKAVYAYAVEDYTWWSEQLGDELLPGTFGENLTIRDVNVSDALVGERWRIGTTLLEVAQPRLPCFKLGIRMGDQGFVRRFSRAERYGAYLRIVEEGHVVAGDAVEVVARPDHDVTVSLVGRAYVRDKALAHRLLAAPALPAKWRTWAEDTSAPDAAQRVRDLPSR